MRQILVVLVSLSLFGCSATRKATRTTLQEAVRIEQAERIESDLTVHESQTTMTDITHDERVITQVEEFDTSQPVDPQTGTPPLKRRIVQTRDNTINVQQEETRETEVEANETIDRETTEERESEQNDETRKGLTPLQGFFLTVGILAFLFLFIWIIIRITKKHLKL